MPREASIIRYRPDVDGLRAVAVLAVVGFHAAPRWVPGGFVGVDIFFVISGFLISAILFAQNEAGQFSFFDFYARRIRRIVPALAVVLVAVWAVGWSVLVDSEYRQLERHLAGGAVFLSNALLWRETGYFDPPSELKPLLHLWSLGVEEQFYLVWPPLVCWCWKRGINVFSATFALIATSFALNVALVGTSAAAAFYLPHTRLWELLLGGLLAYLVSFRREEIDRSVTRLVFTAPGREAPRAVANLKAWLGVALIAVAVFGLGKNPAFPGWWFGVPGLRELAIGVGLDKAVYPGWWAVIPTVGAALLVWAGPEACFNRTVLARPAAVFVGLISYPLYLWHWPLLSFLQVTESGHPTRALRAWAVTLSFLLAWLTYRVVEQPIRRAVTTTAPLRIAAVAVTLLIVALLSEYSVRTDRWHSRTAHFVTTLDAADQSPRNDDECRAHFNTPGECQQYARSGVVSTVLLGDSHAQHFLYGVGSRLASRHENVAHLGATQCPPLVGVEAFRVGDPERCGTINETVIRSVADDRMVARVLLSFRGTVYVTGRGYGPMERDLQVVFRLRDNRLLSPRDSLARALEDTADYLLRRGKEVWVVLQVPELDFVVTECAGRPFSFETNVRYPCAVPRAAVLERQTVYREVVALVQRRVQALRVFDPLLSLCDEAWCYASLGDRLLYQDGDHLSRAGSLFFADKLPF
jgi:peptidoglycan/LPS O-acetylase OafA/YrhL